jgi:hypothetical protein
MIMTIKSNSIKPNSIKSIQLSQIQSNQIQLMVPIIGENKTRQNGKFF